MKCWHIAQLSPFVMTVQLDFTRRSRSIQRNRKNIIITVLGHNAVQFCMQGTNVSVGGPAASISRQNFNFIA
jgi:hypothetical protein